MPNINVEIKNMAQIKKAFKFAPANTVRQLNKAIKKAIFTIERQSKKNTPVLTGRLRASHTTVFDNLRGVLYPTANYAIYVHEGTRYMRPRPFLAQAVESEELTVQNYFTEAVQEVFNQIEKDI